MQDKIKQEALQSRVGRRKKKIIILSLLVVVFAFVAVNILWNLNNNGIGPQWVVLHDRQKRRMDMLEYIKDEIWQYVESFHEGPAHFNDLVKWHPELVHDLEAMNPAGRMILHVDFRPYQLEPGHEPIPVVVYDAPDEEHLFWIKGEKARVSRSILYSDYYIRKELSARLDGYKTGIRSQEEVVIRAKE